MTERQTKTYRGMIMRTFFEEVVVDAVDEVEAEAMAMAMDFDADYVVHSTLEIYNHMEEVKDETKEN
jgi:hypothetical protein